ncbi:MAG: FMN-binding protein [Candidatus Izemoplasmatales bacterium]|jgi:ribosomal 30S subunit maturation factor RimM
MKSFMMKHGILVGALVIIAAIFVFGGMYSRYMTEQIDVRAEAERQRQLAEEKRLFEASLLAFFEDATDIQEAEYVGVSKSYLKPGKSGPAEGDYFQPTLDGSYLVYEDDEAVGVVYIISSFGNAGGLKVAYAIDFATDQIIGVKVISHNETDDDEDFPGLYYQKLDSAFFDQFRSFSFNEVVLEVDTIAGATYSGKGFELAAIYAREQYAHDFDDFEIPSVVVTINSIINNLDPDTFVSYPLIANITIGAQATVIDVYLAINYTYLGVASGDYQPSDDEQAEIRNLASTSGMVSNRSWFLSYDETTRTVVMGARGMYPSTPIEVTFVLNDTLDGVESRSVYSRESYYDDYNVPPYGSYVGGPPPWVENTIIDQYLAGETIDTIAGASASTEISMRSLVALLDRFIDSLNGGANG